MQSDALSLMATKMETALAIEGDLSDKGLTAIAEGSNSMLIEMARTLIGEEKTSSASDAWRAYRRKEIRSDSFLGVDEDEREITSTSISRGSRSTTITYERVVRGRIYTRKGYAIAYVNKNKFYFQNGQVFYNKLPVGKYEPKGGIGELNGKPVQIMKDPRGYVLVELKA